EVHADRHGHAVLLPHRGLQDRLAQDPERELARESGALDRRHKVRWGKDPARRMPPANERLDCDETAVAHRDDRLVVQDELVLDDRLLELEAGVDAHASVPCASSHSVAADEGGVRPRSWYARSVATRPRGVRLR